MSSSTSSVPPVASAASNPDVRLESTLQIEPSRLVARWTLTVSGKEALLVFDGTLVRGAGGAPKFAPSHAYVWYPKPNAAALILGVPRTPIRKSVEEAIVPWVHRLSPGQSLHRELSLPLPLDETNPYYPAHGGEALQREVIHQLSLIVEYSPVVPEVVSTPVEGTSGLSRFVSGPISLREIRNDWTLAQPLPGRRRSDRFEPFKAEAL